MSRPGGPLDEGTLLAQERRPSGSGPGPRGRARDARGHGGSHLSSCSLGSGDRGCHLLRGPGAGPHDSAASGDGGVDLIRGSLDLPRRSVPPITKPGS